jgi:Mrp family chromosome partitioning ATPase
VKTLLVDVNLRQPRIDALFGGSDASVGLNQCLSGAGGDFGAYISSDVLANLSVMFAGGQPRNPQELLASDRFADLMNFCLRDYDMTILDTPPANSCSDVHRVATELETDGAMIVGTVMTEV